MIKRIEKEIRQLGRERGADRLFVLTDSNVVPLISNFLPDCPRLAVDAGEESKSLDGAVKVWNFLEREGALRRSALVNVGGGMVSDLGGFAASAFKRGIGTINVPTTLLAAVDAAIGGKTGVNFRGLKNEIGSFHLPWGVFPLTSLFRFLPENEWLSGVGEAIKTGLLHSRELFDLATSEDFIIGRDAAVVEKVVALCQDFKMRIVAQDFKDRGVRRILNLGHTAGHALEALRMGNGDPIPHGVAVAHGLRFALERSVAETGFPAQILAEYETVLSRYFPALNLDVEDLREMERLMRRDKKNCTAGQISWVLLRDIGRV